MYSLDEIAKSMAAMDDSVLIQRWKGDLTDQARPLAAAELQKRGIDLGNPVPRPSQYDVGVSPHSFKPRFLPAIFAATSAITFGRELGSALWGAAGAALFSAILAVVGWYIGGIVASFAHKRKRVAVRILICAVAFLAWLYLSGVGVVLARLMSGASLGQA